MTTDPSVARTGRSPAPEGGNPPQEDTARRAESPEGGHSKKKTPRRGARPKALLAKPVRSTEGGQPEGLPRRGNPSEGRQGLPEGKVAEGYP